MGEQSGLDPLLDVTLLANSVCFREPRNSVHITACGKPEGVNMIARRDGLHLAEARVLDPPREHNMAIEPIRPRCDLRE